VSGLRLAGTGEAADLASFLGRAVALDPAAVTRLRVAGGRVTAYVRLPFGVLVSRTVDGDAEPADVTVGAAALLSALDPPVVDRAAASVVDPAAAPVVDRAVAPVVDRVAAPVPWPGRRDMEWRAALPPADGWRRLDSVPGDVVRALVQAGRDALRAVPAGAAASAGESLLDHESLTVSGAGQTAVLPLRVLGALTRMGFLGDRPDPVVVSAAAGWIRLAAAFGSAYQHRTPGLALHPHRPG
jgi:hypothetical protein